MPIPKAQSSKLLHFLFSNKNAVRSTVFCVLQIRLLSGHPLPPLPPLPSALAADQGRSCESVSHFPSVMYRRSSSFFFTSLVWKQNHWSLRRSGVELWSLSRLQVRQVYCPFRSAFLASQFPSAKEWHVSAVSDLGPICAHKTVSETSCKSRNYANDWGINIAK